MTVIFTAVPIVETVIFTVEEEHIDGNFYRQSITLVMFLVDDGNFYRWKDRLDGNFYRLNERDDGNFYRQRGTQRR